MFVTPIWNSGKMKVTRIEEDSLEVLLSRVVPPHSPNPLTRLLNPKLNMKGNSPISKVTGDVKFVKLGMSVAVEAAKCAR